MFPRWLSWLVLALLAYVVVQGNRASHPVLPTATPTPTTVVAEDKATEVPPPNAALGAATDMERWKRAINPDYAARAQCELTAKPGAKPALLWKVTEDVAGTGEKAHCTDTIQLKFTVWNARGESAYAGEVPFVLGARDVAAGLDAALVGIRVGGVRTVILAPDALLRGKKSAAPKPLLNALGAGRVAIITAERLN